MQSTLPDFLRKEPIVPIRLIDTKAIFISGLSGEIMDGRGP